VSHSEPRRTVETFDVFDTVITRLVADPRHVHLVTAGRLRASNKLPCSVEEFTRVRQASERQLGRLRGRPARLKEIAEEVANLLCLPSALARDIHDAEVDTERELCRAIPGRASLLKEARARSGPVSFISDTPHSEVFLRELLGELALLQPSDRVFTSAERGVSKSSGRLFCVVAESLGVSVGDLKHIGDNANSDVAAARDVGVRATLLENDLSRYERLLLRQAPTELVGRMAGAARLARLRAVAEGVDPALATVAAGVAAPLLIGYSLWLAGQARKNNLTRLYFIARDGEAVMRVAKPILVQSAKDVQCLYLYGSRQAWQFPCTANNPRALESWLDLQADTTARAMLNRVLLAPEEASEALSRAGVARNELDIPLSRESRAHLSAILREDLQHLIAARAAEQRRRLVAYLRQEGLLDGQSYGLVDVGWRGRASRALQCVLDENSGRVHVSVQHFYIGLFAGADVGGLSVSAWLFDAHRGRGAGLGMPAINSLVETLLVGSEGRVVSYDDAGSYYAPRLENQHNEPALSWGLVELRTIVDDVVRLFVAGINEASVHEDLTAAVWSCLEAFWLEPSPQEVQVWGRFPWEDETCPKYSPLAQVVTLRQVLARLKRRDLQLRNLNSWPAGSARMSAQPWRGLISGQAWRRRVWPRLRRLPRRVRLWFWSHKSR
jgi:predicted HAD superfamily hydrolase